MERVKTRLGLLVSEANKLVVLGGQIKHRERGENLNKEPAKQLLANSKVPKLFEDSLESKRSQGYSTCSIPRALV